MLDRVKAIRLPVVPVERKHLAAQVAGVVSMLAGIAAWSWPSACIVGGLVLILAIERQ